MNSRRPLPPNAPRGHPAAGIALDGDGGEEWQRFDDSRSQGAASGVGDEPLSLASSPGPIEGSGAEDGGSGGGGGGGEGEGEGGGVVLSAAVAARMWREIAEADSPRRYSSIVETALLLAELVGRRSQRFRSLFGSLGRSGAWETGIHRPRAADCGNCPESARAAAPMLQIDPASTRKAAAGVPCPCAACRAQVRHGMRTIAFCTTRKLSELVLQYAQVGPRLACASRCRILPGHQKQPQLCPPAAWPK